MQNLIENLKEYLNPIRDGAVIEILESLTVGEISELWHSLEEEDRRQVFLLLPREKRASFMMELGAADQEYLIRELSEGVTRSLLNEMEPDDLVDLIQGVSADIRNAVWEQLNEESRRETTFLLKFDQEGAAGVMTPRYAAILGNKTVAQALHFIRSSMDRLETVYYLYVVDKLKRLQGVVSLKDLLRANDGDLVGDIMTGKVIYVFDDTDREDSAKVLEEHDLLALPVVDRYHRLLGIITFDDVIDVIRQEQTKDIYRMGAMGGNTHSYLASSVWDLVKRRVPWLLILLAAGTVTSNVLYHYQDFIATAAFVVLFIPVITQTGGNSGTQSSTLMIRGLATGELRFSDLGRVMRREVLVGLFIGLATGAFILLRGYFTPPGIELLPAVAVAISLCGVVIFATVLGSLVPMLLHRLGFDPTVAAGPVMSTLIDMIGLSIFFELSRWVLNL